MDEHHMSGRKGCGEYRGDFVENRRLVEYNREGWTNQGPVYFSVPFPCLVLDGVELLMLMLLCGFLGVAGWILIRAVS